MPLHVKCPHCRVTIQNIDRILSGGENRVTCPDCRKPFRVATTPKKPVEQPVADIDLPSLPAPPEPEIPVLEILPDPEPTPIVLELFDDDPPPKPASKRPSSRPVAPKSRPRDDRPPSQQPRGKSGDSAGLYIGLGIGGVAILIVAIILFFIPGQKPGMPDSAPQVVQKKESLPKAQLKGDEIGKEPNFNNPNRGQQAPPQEEPKLDPNPGFPPNFPGFPPEVPQPNFPGNVPPNPRPRRPQPEKEWDIGLPKADPPAREPGVEIPATPLKVTVERTEGIRRASFEGESKTIDFPGPADSSCVGGGGRFLIFFIRREKQLAIFDVNEAKVVKTLPTPDETTLFAANRTELLTIQPRTRTVKRFSLQSFDEVGTWQLPQGGWLYLQAMMGSDSNGPLIVATSPRSQRLDFDLFDPVTGGELPSPQVTTSLFRYSPSGGQAFVTADGKRLCYTNFALRGQTILKITENGIELPPEPPNRSSPAFRGNYSFIVPNRDASEFYGQGQLYDPEGQPVGKQVGAHGNTIWFTPAVEGKFFLSFVEVKGTPPKPTEVPLHVGIHLPGSTEPLALIPPLAGTANFLHYPTGQSVPFHRHAFFVPSADLLAILSADKQKLHLHRVNVTDLLQKGGQDYLIVEANTFDVKRGEKWEAPLKVFSKKDKVEVRVERGPTDLKVTPEGKLAWEVPKDISAMREDVVLHLTDKAGKETTHTIRLRIVP